MRKICSNKRLHCSSVRKKPKEPLLRRLRRPSPSRLKDLRLSGVSRLS
jgi:hypothetical protein